MMNNNNFSNDDVNYLFMLLGRQVFTTNQLLENNRALAEQLAKSNNELKDLKNVRLESTSTQQHLQ